MEQKPIHQYSDEELYWALRMSFITHPEYDAELARRKVAAKAEDDQCLRG